MVGPGMSAVILASVGLVLREAAAATVMYDFDITWVTANPDGACDRPTIGINGEWPIPRIEANVGDDVIVNVKNQLGNQSTSLHFHGLYMNGSTHMDGPSQVSQCAIPPGESFTYKFKIDQPGTYWYHSHANSQYPDGLRGPLIIHDPGSPFKDQYDEELVVTLSDWYHDQMAVLIPKFMSKTNPTGAEPVPNAALINETQDFKISVQPGQTYLFRMVNIGAFAGQYFWVEGHDMTIIEVDGVYTKPKVTDMIYLSAGQRTSFLLTTKDNAESNFAFVGSMDITLFDVLPDDLQWNVTGWLDYDAEKPYPKPKAINEFDPLDDMELAPHDEMELLPEPDRVVTLDVIMDNLGDGANYAFFNNITYAAPKVPTLYTALTTGELAMNSQVYGEFTHPFVLQKDEIVQIVLNNQDDGRHPFHIHGHSFQSIYRSPEDAGSFEDSGITEDDFHETPMRRDTLLVYPNGNIVMRFKADNPGVWLFHCHLEWHLASGLIATFIEAPLELQKTIKLPQDHLDNCASGGVPTAGNAAARTENLLDLSGQNRPPHPLPEGFTPRGVVAFVFSCLTGVIGVGVVIWYGLNPINTSSESRDGAGRGLLEDFDRTNNEGEEEQRQEGARDRGEETPAS